MGLYDRDYYRQRPPSGVGAARVWSLTTWLIVINIVVFCLEPLVERMVSPDVFRPYFSMSDSLFKQWGVHDFRSPFFAGNSGGWSPSSSSTMAFGTSWSI